MYEQKCSFGLTDMDLQTYERFYFSGEKNGPITGKAVKCV